MAAIAVAIPHSAQAQTAATAIPGRPFGIGSVQVPVPVPLDERLPWNLMQVTERNGRVFYPALRSGLLPGGVAERAPAAATLSFLFVGDQPLELTVHAPRPMRFTIDPRSRPPRAYRRQMMRWWRDFNATVRQDGRSDDFPQMANVYLTSMLGRRLGLDPPLLSRNTQPTGSELQQVLELLAGAEGLREQLAFEMMRTAPGSNAAAALPRSVEWLAAVPPDGQPPAVDNVEAMARHVPAECFYVRFGTFANYLWLNRLLQEHGGDIGRMVSLRGQDPALNQRIQDQLALHQSALAEILGGQVIQDVALIGRDLYLAEGAAIGVLFHARNNFALAADLRQQRATALQTAREFGATLEEVEIAGRAATFLSTPDNRLRSYYIVDGDFHLVTTSESIARRFVETGQVGGALADTWAFQQARQAMPTERGDTIFAYFSPEFFQALLHPEYQIGLRRRLQADTAIVLLQLAELAARSEGMEDPTLDKLAAAQFLPAGFGRLADQSGPILSDHETFDSLRGARGSFTPIPDLPLERVSAEEAAWYEQLADYFQEKLRQMDPLIVAVRRSPGDQPNVERISLDANISPLAEEKYGQLLSVLGPPTTEAIRAAPDDIISLQAMVTGGMLSNSVAPHHLFLGIKDSPMPPLPWADGFFDTVKMLQATPGYLGAWPELGFLDWLPFGLAGQPDIAGYSQLPLGAWRWQGDGFSMVSFQQDVLAGTIPHLDIVPTDRPAQIRMKVGDLSKSHLSNWIQVQYYQRAFQASLGNVRFMNRLSSQFGVPIADSRQVAERLLNAELVCALGGEYELVSRGGHEIWRSTAWSDNPEEDRAECRAPLLRWFRGATLELTKSGEQLVMQATLDMHRETRPQGPTAPFWKLFGSGSESEKPADESR